MSTILVQGAMQEEIELLARMLPGGRWTEQKGYSFYETGLHETKIILSLTQVGILHACISTMLGIERYKPDALINQGTAGGHVRTLEIGDIVIGETRAPEATRSNGSRWKRKEAPCWRRIRSWFGRRSKRLTPERCCAEDLAQAICFPEKRTASICSTHSSVSFVRIWKAPPSTRSAICTAFRSSASESYQIMSSPAATRRRSCSGKRRRSCRASSTDIWRAKARPSRPTAILFQKQPIFKKKIKINCTLTAPYRFSIITIRINRHGVLYEAEGLA